MSLQLANRLAWRDIKRNRGRSILIVLLIGLPLAGLSWLSSSVDAPVDQEGALNARFGDAPAVMVPLETSGAGGCVQPDLANAWCESTSADKPTAPVLTQIDPGVKTGTSDGWRSVTLAWRATTLDARIAVTDVSKAASGKRIWLNDPVIPGANEVLISMQGAALLGLGKGDTVSLGGTTQTIVGSYRNRGLPEAWFVVTPTNALAAGATAAQVALGSVPTADQVKALNRQGVAVLSRDAVQRAEQLTQYSNETQMLPFIIGLAAMILMVTGTIASAAFAIGFRQQRRSLALLSATGASAPTLRGIVVQQGLLLGAMGAGFGTALGVGAALLTQWWGRKHGTEYPPPYSLSWLTLAVLVLVAVLTAVIAAWVPARQVADSEVMTAVRRAEAAAHPARRPWIGIGLAVLGLAVGVLGSIYASKLATQPGYRMVEKGVIPAVASVVLLFFAALVSTGWLLERIGSLFSGRGLAWRLAARDWTRNRGRAAAVVAATMAMMTLASTFLITVDSVGRTDRADWRPDQPEKLISVRSFGQAGSGVIAETTARVEQVMGPPTAKLAAQLPVSKDADPMALVTTLRTCDDAGGCMQSNGEVVLGDATTVKFLGGADAPAAAAMLAQGGLVVFDPGLVKDGNVTVQVRDTEAKVPALVVPGDPLAPAVAGQALLAKVGITEYAEQTIQYLLYQQRPTSEQQNQLDQVVLELNQGKVAISYDSGPDDTYHSILVGAALVLGALLLVVAIIATSLALRDGHSTMEMLAGVGASRWTLRAMSAVQAAATTALGVVLGLVIGAVPLVAVIAGTGGYVLLAIPWLLLVALVIGAPLVLAGVGWLLPPARARLIRID